MDFIAKRGASGECFGGEKSSFRAGCSGVLAVGVPFLLGGCSGVLAVGYPLFSTGGEQLASLWEGEIAAEEGDTEVGEAPLRG